MNEIDRAALTRAVWVARKDTAQRRWIDERLAAGQGWEEVARSCSCYCQSISLDLPPWHLGLSHYARDLAAALREPFGDASGEREAGEIIKKLRALNLSQFEPDPIGAITEAEQRRAAG